MPTDQVRSELSCPGLKERNQIVTRAKSHAVRFFNRDVSGSSRAHSSFIMFLFRRGFRRGDDDDDDDDGDGHASRTMILLHGPDRLSRYLGSRFGGSGMGWTGLSPSWTSRLNRCP